MLAAIVVFVVVVVGVFAANKALSAIPARLEQKRLEKRLFDVSRPIETGDELALVKQTAEGPLPGVDRILSKTNAGPRLARLIEQSGVKTTPSAVILLSLAGAGIGALACLIFVRIAFLVPVAAIAAGMAPIGYLLQRRGARLRAFEEQFPEALDLMSRALRAGHAFQTAMGMVGDELKEPVGPEFKKTFDQQNYGLPLREALTQLADRVGSLDVRFFVTSVLIQRETGGNLSEILDNLAHVVRERFKIRRQVRIHTAHGRFTAFVLLALPPGLGIVLTLLNPEHMDLLFKERLGHLMIAAAMIMQAIGFFWIRKVIKIEV
jgi:tight adherence protein B